MTDERKWVKARIRWLTKEEGGRQHQILPGTRYGPLIFFKDYVYPRGETWSSDIYTEKIDENNESVIRLSFLVEWAPFELMTVGREFGLYEGAQLVAEGVILEEDV
ncbi:MAG: hypothetical protein LBN30_04155 [Oscillospiraceae bacterium]|jgi:hypothetical protein|nr:hypothetical protein [Oscillospiraceae bacterium]